MTHGRRGLKVGLLVVVGAVTACSRAEAPSGAVSENPPIAAGAVASAASPSTPLGNGAVTQRKIVRTAELDLEVKSPSAAQTAIARLAEEHGGYVVSAARDTDRGSAVDVHVTIVVRVSQAELTTTIAALKLLGRGIGSERIVSDDVTDEYVDLAARIASQKQLEQQYLEILKRAVTVKDAMEVQKELALVAHRDRTHARAAAAPRPREFVLHVDGAPFGRSARDRSDHQYFGRLRAASLVRCARPERTDDHLCHSIGWRASARVGAARVAQYPGVLGVAPLPTRIVGAEVARSSASSDVSYLRFSPPTYSSAQSSPSNGQYSSSSPR